MARGQETKGQERQEGMIMVMLSLDHLLLTVIRWHGNQQRDEGIPYYTHPITVAFMVSRKGYDEDHIYTALFHDVLEDCKDITPKHIEMLTSRTIADAVQLLTKKKGYKPSEYYEAIAKNDIARVVKVADRLHNLLSMWAWTDKGRQRRYLDETIQYIMPIVPYTKFGFEFGKVIGEAEVRLRGMK